MGVTEIIAFIRAFPALVEEIKSLRLEISGLRMEAIDKELSSIRNEVNTQIQILTAAKNDEDRKKALLALSNSISR